MRKSILLYTLLFFISLNITASVRDTININMNWKFSRGENAPANSKEWQEINLPHDFQISQPWVAPSESEEADNRDEASNIKSRLSPRGFKEMGTGWYKKTITPENTWQGKRILLDFQGIMLVGDVYLNGERIGETDYGYVGFDIDISNKLKYGEPNEILVRASTQKAENSRWYTGGALFRDVNIIMTNKDC